ncbi:MAG: sel1 repeat family protein, partial [Desulfuromonadales bacterium]|nr:sel1 repeat family protein [Desulfuromonadales bacterium]
MISNFSRIFILIILSTLIAINANAFKPGPGYKASQTKQFAALIEAANQGDAAAQVKVGNRHFAAGQYDHAFYWLKKASDQNIASAQYSLAQLYYNGAGTERNREKA